MPFSAALSTKPATRDAITEVVAARDALPGRPDLAVAFVSTHHGKAIDEIAPQLVGALEPHCLIGCQGEGIIGTGREIENEPAICLWLAHWGGRVDVEPLHLTASLTPDGPTLFGWPDALVETSPSNSMMLLLGDPFTFPAADLFLPRVNEDCPGLRVHGGMASGMAGPGHAVLFLNDEPHDDGAVGALLRGPAGMRGVVSQGCRPVGQPFVITKARDNIIFELGGVAPVHRIRELLESLPTRDRQLFQNGPHLGVAMTEYKDRFGPGDFLVRNLVGLDPQNGAVGISDRAKAGQTVQFMIRDAAGADADLRALLKDARGATAGALLFSCNGRGTKMFPHPHHDAGAIQEEVGPVPLAGFFAAGELGPVAGNNYLHGFTASAVLFGD